MIEYDGKPLTLVETLQWLVKRDDLNEGDKKRYDELLRVLAELDEIAFVGDDDLIGITWYNSS